MPLFGVALFGVTTVLSTGKRLSLDASWESFLKLANKALCPFSKLNFEAPKLINTSCVEAGNH